MKKNEVQKQTKDYVGIVKVGKPVADGKGTSYTVCDDLEVTIFEGENSDTAYVTLFGAVKITCKIREGKKGAFLSLPSFKGSDGEYKDLVKIFSKEIWTDINGLLGAIYQ